MNRRFVDFDERKTDLLRSATPRLCEQQKKPSSDEEGGFAAGEDGRREKRAKNRRVILSERSESKDLPMNLT